MINQYTPPYCITPSILHSIEQIGEALGKFRVGADSAVVPVLRRGNRIKTVQASLAIEGNTLSPGQVTAVLAGKRVLAKPREIQEVRNAFADYEKMAIEESTFAANRKKTLQKTLEETPQKTPGRIVSLLKQNGLLTIGELARQIGKSPSAVQRALNKLQEKRHIERIGPAKGGHCVVKEKP